jgi:hypothetical protein
VVFSIQPRARERDTPDNAGPALGRRYLVGVVIVWGIVLSHPVLYLDAFAGDAGIHLVYAEAAANGHFLEFNPNEKSAGVTSPGYMLLLSVLFAVFSPAAVPVLAKALSILSWYGLVFLVFTLSNRLWYPDLFTTGPSAWKTGFLGLRWPCGLSWPSGGAGSRPEQ